jgi:predicted enzyme related to lactoylglutathione lyase
MNMSGLMIGSEEPSRMVAFYTELFGDPTFDEGGYTTWQLGTGWVTVAAHDQVKGENVQPGRLMWNLESDDVPGDFERCKTAGATVVAEPYNPGDGSDDTMRIATLADPDGNYFQLMSPMSEG